MRAGARDLHRRLAILRKRMQHPSAYEKALSYFGDEFAMDESFLAQSVWVDSGGFQPMLEQLVAAVLREHVQLDEVRTLHLSGSSLYHGCARASRRVVMFFYCEDLGIGIAALIPGLRGAASEVIRFRFLLPPAKTRGSLG